MVRPTVSGRLRNSVRLKQTSTHTYLWHLLLKYVRLFQRFHVDCSVGVILHCSMDLFYLTQLSVEWLHHLFVLAHSVCWFFLLFSSRTLLCLYAHSRLSKSHAVVDSSFTDSLGHDSNFVWKVIVIDTCWRQSYDRLLFARRFVDFCDLLLPTIFR